MRNLPPLRFPSRCIPALLAACATVLLAGCCEKIEVDPGPVRLVDIFADARVADSPASVPPPEPTRWTFTDVADDPAERDPEWSAAWQVEDLQVRDGHLVGRTTGERPFVLFRRKSGLDRVDVVHEVQVRLRATAGTTLGVVLGEDDGTPVEQLAQFLDAFPFSLETPLIADGQMRTYTLSTESQPFTPSYPASSTELVAIQVGDAAGSDFEIESVRLVFRGEHLASIESGVGWHGLSDVYRETLVTRSPETVSFDVRLPPSAIFDVAVGLPEAAALRFEVAVRNPRAENETEIDAGAGSDAEAAEPLRRIERTVTRADRWQHLSMDLSDLAGQKVTLTLSLSNAATGEPGTIGFWGAPALRTPSVRTAGEPARASRSDEVGEPPQGVVFVVADTLRRDRLEIYGHGRQTAPTLAAMAANGVLFRDNVSQGAWTKVSVPSMMTSLYPTTLGIVEFADRVPAAATTLAEAFREAGYATWGSSGVPFSGRLSNLHQGYEVLHESTSFEDEVRRGKTARVITDRFLGWLDATLDDGDETPFFAVLHYMDPHSPYRTYRPWDTLWATEQDWIRYRELQDRVRPFIENPENVSRGLPTRDELLAAEIDPDEFVRVETDGYDASTRAMDLELGRVVERLRHLGLEGKTLVVVLSDHGEEFLDHGDHFHEHDVYGEMINVPLVFHWPGVLPAGRTVDATTENVDVYPTLLRLAGLATEESLAELGLQGHSLLPLMVDDEDTADAAGAADWDRRPAFSEWTRRAPQRERGGVDQRSVIHQGWKLIHNVERPEGRAEYELYDHETDPFDAHDVAADHPDVVERLAKLLDGWHRSAEDARLRDEEALEGMSAEELERLRSLGYIQ